MRGYFNCHNHTEYSNLRLKDCNIRVKTLVDFLIKNNLRPINWQI